MATNNKLPYRIVAFYDSETNNVADFKEGIYAFPVLHQLGKLKTQSLRNVNNENVEKLVEVETFRHTFELTAALDSMIEEFRGVCVPVVCVHNLGFDMWALSEWLTSHDVRVLAKSAAKPITFTIRDDDGNPCFVLWDTLSFTLRPLAAMGDDCGFPKLTGAWDYDLQRTPNTPLDRDELAYAKHDIYVLAAWFGWWLRRNPEIKEEKLALNVVTKTGVVREKRSILFNMKKGVGCKWNCGRFWLFQNRKEVAKSDDELFTMHAATRGGFTFCASSWASIPLELEGDELVAGFDATSQHPSQMVSRFVPERFNEADCDALEIAARIVSHVTLEIMLKQHDKPFPVAFNACFRFTNLRIKPNSVFDKNGISSLAWARMSNLPMTPNEDNAAADSFREQIGVLGYKDKSEGATYSFGKLNSARVCELYLTELEYWNVCQIYDFDSVEAVHGYITTRFCRPTDYSVLSVMHFYKAKNVYKDTLERYLKREPLTNLDELAPYVPDSILEGFRQGTLTDAAAKSYYQQIKSDLNSLFGIEATNEARDDMVLTSSGIAYEGVAGIANLPKNPKAWYQFGQRIVGWSRVAQVVHMLLAEPYIKGIVNGDTDSLKFYTTRENLPKIERAFSRYARAIERGRKVVCARVEKQYPDAFYDLEHIGDYVLEFEVQRFCAAWNKAYTIQKVDKRDGKLHFDFTLAGVPTSRGAQAFNKYADYLFERGWSFAEICNVLLGYNLTIDSSITRLNMRAAPQWGETFTGVVRDYLGTRTRVCEPRAMALYPMNKIIGGLNQDDNRINVEIAKRNNPAVNDKSLLISWPENPSLIDLDSGVELLYG